MLSNLQLNLLIVGGMGHLSFLNFVFLCTTHIFKQQLLRIYKCIGKNIELYCSNCQIFFADLNFQKLYPILVDLITFKQELHNHFWFMEASNFTFILSTIWVEFVSTFEYHFRYFIPDFSKNKAFKCILFYFLSVWTSTYIFILLLYYILNWHVISLYFFYFISEMHYFLYVISVIIFFNF